MSSSIQTEARLILVSAAAGAGLMAVYDCLRIFRSGTPQLAVGRAGGFFILDFCRLCHLLSSLQGE